MFFANKRVFLVRILIVYASFGFNRADEYKIGAIFDEVNTNQEAALKEAVKEINRNDENIDLDLIVKHIPKDNPYLAARATCSLLQEGVVGIFGPMSEDNSNTVQSICDMKEIPHIEVRWDDYPTNGTLINLYPYPDTLTRTYYDLIVSWGWKDFVILYENNESLQRVGELLKLFDPSSHRIVVRQLNVPKSGGNFRSVLKEIWRSGATHFVLDCSIEILEEVLKQAQQVGLMTNKHNFMITNLDLHTIELMPYQYSETNITGMRFVDPDDEGLAEKAKKIYKQNLEVFTGYKLRLEEALIFDAVMMFAEALKAAEPLVEPYSISCYNDKEKLRSGTTIVNMMKNLEYIGLTGPIKFDIKGFRTNFALDVFELMEGGQTVVGHWNNSKIPALNISRLYPPSDLDGYDIRNKTFKVMITLTEPYGMRVESMDPLYGNDQYEGFAVDIIKELAAMRGFNYTFLIREDKANGNFINTTGKWNGIIGDLIDEVADLAICDLTITKERAEAVDFTGPFMMLGVAILYSKPTKAPPSFFSFADPFAFEVWKLLMVSWIGVALILFVLGRISPNEWENPYPCIEEPEYLVNQLDLRNCIWFITGSIMQQGSEIELKSISTRMIAGMWWFFTLLMVSSYTANLAAFLTTEKPDPHFNNLHELVENAEVKKITIGAKAGGATETFLRDKWLADENSDFGKAYQLLLKDKDKIKIIENSDGVTQAQKGYYAFFMEDQSIQYETQRKCDLYQVNGKLDEKGYGLAMRKNSTYRSSLSTAILLMQNSGKLEKFKRKWWEERRGGGQCSDDGGSSDATPLNLKGVEGVFWVTIGGTIFAIFVAILETLLYCRKKAKRNNSTYLEALKEEFKFYLRFSEMEKPMGGGEDVIEEQSDDKDINYQIVKNAHSAETLQSNHSSKSKKSRRSKSRNKNKLRPPSLSSAPVGWRDAQNRV
ncbi:glutamate receptor ionotropic, kainate 2-like [Diabrotica undecimpunctata]|uniref:glutamate receptor ionotropic, kainate 2-like n=1 Tax=Diabrotica undecimpunctata TaxID=50387 RepID=UPI003B638652